MWTHQSIVTWNKKRRVRTVIEFMAEFEQGGMLQNHSSKACFASEMEFINSQLMRKDHSYNMGPFSAAGTSSAFTCHLPPPPPPLNFTDQMTLFQSDLYHHHELSADSDPTLHSLGFGGGDFIKKGKSSSEQLFNFTSPSASHETALNKMELGGGKKRKRNNNALEKPKEVVHVRAKRGQATDSHSLAERVRRAKINEKLRCLQDLVPGCYKTMGMAVMLDVISNYVRSLQNQIEFLSMKLSAASMYSELNLLEMAMDTTEHLGADA